MQNETDTPGATLGNGELEGYRDGRLAGGVGERVESGHSNGVSAPVQRVEDGKIVIELSSAQVDRVVRGAADGGNISVLLSGLKDVREVLAREPAQLEDSRLSRSLLAGLLMLASFPTDGSYLGNAEIARMLDMNPSTTHRYVSTLVAVGLLERDPSTRRYRLV
ncbi:MAG TPA: helix-turn-helix domain-containing protein [Solirubrobacteraceae bacterium]|nr:helix-turn-helix domain-containing protein [Solirubrobacteraceae bacterium]